MYTHLHELKPYSTTYLHAYIHIYLHLLTNSMAQQPMKNFDRPLMKDILSDSILITLNLIFC